MTSSPLPLSQTSLHPKYQARCRRANIFSAHQLLLIPINELSLLLGLEIREVEKILDSIVNRVVPRCSHLGVFKGKGKERSEMEGYRIITGDEELDRTLGDGIRTGLLTEIVGESSCGKSQLALQLAVHTALGSSNKEAGSVALMISEGDTQGNIAVRRMLEMAEDVIRRRWRASDSLSERDAVKTRAMASAQSAHKRRRLVDEFHTFGSLNVEDAVQAAKQQVLRNVHLASIRDLDALEHVVEYTLPGLAHRLLQQQQQEHHDSPGTSSSSQATSSKSPLPPLRLVVVDNLPCLFYATHPTSMNSMVARSRALGTLSDGLKRIARIGSPLDIRDPPKSVLKKSESNLSSHARVEPEKEQMVDNPTSSESEKIGSSLPHRPRTDGGAAIVIINHVSDVFDRDLRALGEMNALSESTSSSTFPKTSRPAGTPLKLSSPSPSNRPKWAEPPLAYCHQSPTFSGLSTSLRAASAVTRVEAGREEDVDPRISHVASGPHHPLTQRGGSGSGSGPGSILFPSSSSSHAHAPFEAQESDPLLDGSFTGAKQAALGHVWNNCINVRIMLCKTGRRVKVNVIHPPPPLPRSSSPGPPSTAKADHLDLNCDVSDGKANGNGNANANGSFKWKKPFSSKLQGSSSLFTATLVFSPHAPRRESFFRITRGGVGFLSDEEVKEGLLAVEYTREDEDEDEDEEEEERKGEEGKDESFLEKEDQLAIGEVKMEQALHRDSTPGNLTSQTFFRSDDVEEMEFVDEQGDVGLEELEAIMGDLEGRREDAT